MFNYSLRGRSIRFGCCFEGLPGMGGSRLLSLFLGCSLTFPLNAAAEPDLRMEGLVVIGAAIGHDIVR